jgi:hypothetical protein
MVDAARIGRQTANGPEAQAKRAIKDVAQQAFNAGGMAYVVKICDGTDLLVAMDAALEGKQFRSAAVSGKRSVSRG